jgi:C-terminal processing protease CtpA/Prc
MHKLKPILIIPFVALLLVACQDQDVAPTSEPISEVEPATSTTEPQPTDRTEPTSTTPPPATEVADEPVQEEQEEPQPTLSDQVTAHVINDEGGPVSISGVMTYTNRTLMNGTAEPVVILEDQAGFVDRNQWFIMPVASQTLGQITSDFLTSPFSYTISLPIEPQGSYRDVDNDGEDDSGVQTYAVAYWTNTFGDPYLEERDLSGGGWSTAYVSTKLSDDASTEREIIGGKFLIFSPDDEQGFPSGFGEDGLLFTEDDPIVIVPQGYSVVDLDAEPFTFDRAKNQVIDLIEPEGTALDDYSELSYVEAFDALVEQLSKEYAFTEFKGIDWDALHEEFRPQFEAAEASGSGTDFHRALRDFSWSIPDGHVQVVPFLAQDFQEDTAGGLGLAMREVDDGRILVNFLLPGGPADDAGMELGAEILSLNGVDIDEAVSSAVVHSAPFSTQHAERLQKLRYATRFPLSTGEVEVTYRNPESTNVQSAVLPVVPESQSFSFSSLFVDNSGFEQPLEYELLEDSGFGYVKIFSFFDNELLTAQLWERLMRNLNESGTPGLIIDLRQNGGGSGFLADQMAAYLFDEPLALGQSGRYDEELDDFFFDSRSVERFYPPAEELRYHGEVAVIVGPNCNSACEFFAYDTSLEDRSAIIGHYPTGGLGGGIKVVAMPEDLEFRFTQVRAVDADGNIHIEGQGVAPTVLVPVTEETLFSDGDPLLDAAVAYLQEALLGNIVEGQPGVLGESLEGQLDPDVRVRHTVSLSAGDVIDIFVESDDFAPVLGIYLEDGTLLGTTEEPVEALEIPFDLSLILEVSTNGADGGAYTLRVVESTS